MSVPEAATSNEKSTEAATVVADLGSRSKKSIRKLRQGGGRLQQDVQNLMNQLKADSVVTEASQAVIVVVKEKRRRRMFSF
jgi:gas vesicle protein